MKVVKDVAGLAGQELDYWVTVVEGKLEHFIPGQPDRPMTFRECQDYGISLPQYSCDQGLALPIINRFEIEITPSIQEYVNGLSNDPVPTEWDARLPADRFAGHQGAFMRGKTPLEAAMRAYVASARGHEVPVE